MATQEGTTGVTEADVTHYSEDDDPLSHLGEEVDYDLSATEEEEAK